MLLASVERRSTVRTDKVRLSLSFESLVYIALFRPVNRVRDRWAEPESVRRIAEHGRGRPVLNPWWAELFLLEGR